MILMALKHFSKIEIKRIEDQGKVVLAFLVDFLINGIQSIEFALESY
jgi:hypothetical protein